MTELYHFGIKGQRWGVRRFQSPDGTLTAAGKARYKAYKKDFKSYDKLNRHVSASQKHLKEEGVMLDRVRDKYLKTNKAYRKEMSRSSGLFGLKAAKKADRVAKAQYEMDTAAKDYSDAANKYGLAKKIVKNDVRDLSRHVDNMIRKYGEGSINKLQTETVKIGQNKLQKLLQGAPMETILNKSRETEEFIKTGKTLADLPVIGNLYTAKYIANAEYKLNSQEIEKGINAGKRKAGGKDKKPKYLNDDYFDGVSSKGESSEKTTRSNKESKQNDKGDDKEDKARKKKEAERDRKLASIDKQLNDLGYVTRKQQKANERALKKHKKEVKKANEQLRDQLQRNVDLEQKGYKSRGIVANIAGSAAGAAAGAAATAAAGPIAGYAAKQGIKAYAKRKAKKRWQKWLGHSATYRVVSSVKG